MEKSRKSRKQFILAQGATCANWNWSWSFVNEKEGVIIFGSGEEPIQDGKRLILGKSWVTGSDGKRKAPGYGQSRGHIDLIKGGYQLKTFPLIYSRDASGQDPVRLAGFYEDLQCKDLEELDDGWYACDKVKVLRK
jgi:5-methylcytosine-specific restriction protein A